MSTETMEVAEVTEAEVAETEAADNQVAEQTVESIPARTIELEHYSEICELNRELMAATREFESSKEDASSKKKFMEELGKRLSYLIARGPDYQQKLPFEANENSDQVTDSQPDNAWREVPVVDALSLTAKQLDKLDEAGVRTMGQLEDLRGGDGLGSIHGFGQATIDKIEDQSLAWLTENRDRFGEVVSDDQGDGDEQLGDED